MYIKENKDKIDGIKEISKKVFGHKGAAIKIDKLNYILINNVWPDNNRNLNVFQRRYGLIGKGIASQKEIALYYGVSTPCICNIERTTIRKLRRYGKLICEE